MKKIRGNYKFMYILNIFPVDVEFTQTANISNFSRKHIINYNLLKYF